MAEYKFVTYWNVDAPVESVWQIIQSVRNWHSWWPGVLEVRELKPGIDDDRGALFAHTWRSFLPYKLKFVTEITDVVPLQTIAATVTGELEGSGKWEFIRDDANRTTVVYYWFVSTTTPWMNITAPLLSNVFRWNHDAVMRWGSKGLSRKLNCHVGFSSEWIH